MTSGITSGLAYLPGGRPGPGVLAEVSLELLDIGPAHLALPEVIVRDERAGVLFGGVDLHVEPAAGGGPVGTPEDQLRARAFGVVNVAFHAQRALRTANNLLGRPLPRLLVRIGMHEQSRRWGGGHYRVAARQFDPAEPVEVEASGEVHLGGGSVYLAGVSGEPYWNAPAHNLAIVYHEVGHHICRHTADFRLNHLRPALHQTNKKVAIDEGTCDLLTAIMLDEPDIYGWHRVGLPATDQRRRMLDPRWTMAHFHGGTADPHADGTLWASACWSARSAVIGGGHGPDRFDRMLLRGMELSARLSGTKLSEQALRRRRYFAGMLEAMLLADPDLTDPVLAGMAAHGIRPGVSNAELRDRARAGLAAVTVR